MEANDIIAAARAVTSKWCKQRKAEERQSSRALNRAYVMTHSYRITIKDVAWDVMEEAYLKTSSNSQYPTHARQIMYAARPQILARAECGNKFDDAYFTQVLLPDYMQEHPEETAGWNVVFDARGHLFEPHTKKRVALGTLEVRGYLESIAEHEVQDIDDVDTDLNAEEFPTMGPANRYSAILFIEKEGFMPLFEAAQLGKRYDIAIMSTKGVSNTASRLLVDNLCDDDVPLLVLHDFDKAGFSILGTLQRDTRRYEFTNQVNVIDLGLRLEDVQKWNLQAEPCSYGKSAPARNLRENGATDEEIKYLCGGYSYHGYSGQRVELNAFTSADLLAWIEGKLRKHGIKKVIPDGETLTLAYRRAVLANRIDKEIESLVETTKDEVDGMKLSAGRIAREVSKRLKEHPEMSWDQAIAEIAAEQEDEQPSTTESRKD